MNIFILDTNHDKCAEYHVDKHIVKMPLEAAQMLCTTHWIDKFLGYVPRKLNKEELKTLREKKKNVPRDFPYLPTMGNHPCTIWARTSLDNYEWLFCYSTALNDEYGYRYAKSHKSVHEVILSLPEPYAYQEMDSLHLLRLCQTRSRVQTQSQPTEDSTTKTKQPLQPGQEDPNQNGG